MKLGTLRKGPPLRFRLPVAEVGAPWGSGPNPRILVLSLAFHFQANS